jgi:putative methionine-R-sulfoxide reductase with GAF domain
LLDDESGDLVFEAVAGEGEGWLPGTRFPAGTGIAGWTVMYGQPLIIDDVSQSPQFARDVAENTGYVPRSIMAAPLLHDGDCVGVLEVLDRDSRPRCDLADLESLGLIATETAVALALLVRLRCLETELADRGGAAQLDGLPLLRRLADRLPAAPAQVGTTVMKLLTMADELLAEAAGDTGGPRA